MKVSALSKRMESSNKDDGADSTTGGDDAGVAREDKDGSQSEAKDEADLDLESDSDHHVASVAGLLVPRYGPWQLYWCSGSGQLLYSTNSAEIQLFI
ncbi:hypothetical protein BN14_09097 [Rhizoctonia solani AG-1 IB]|uniref:Uncharacterized protein n=1 Tax=Thanatephorus cucumeris (strain AG1-IB / isolate 7/3/14) TaxID=1108050 RepID=M5C6N8_THACB|nr:hypothetical protein BN14_09097 [Rhizoctonia solani AG-1 IB]